MAGIDEIKGVGKSETLYVGDSVSDFYAAHSAYLQFIAVLTGSASRNQFRAVGVRTQDILGSIIELSMRLGQQRVLRRVVLP